ncbi:MAG: type II toxin-antitoxin system PemK/MazF family toxin [Candidatus Marinimicrobia bacterium]|nr:type II toxin-antitoxin system PemK/MazF family toxin [Candidatus Neomarinimicrobiota bacterium]
MQKGEIWWASLPLPRRSEPGKKRPVLILQSDHFNKSKINTIICAIITSNTDLSGVPGTITLSKRESNLSKKSIVNLSQIVTLDKSYLSDYVVMLPGQKMNEIERELKIVFSIE